MLNQIILVGRLVSDPEINETENGKKGIIKLAIPRSFKNVDGEYETDFVECVLWKAVADNVKEYCKKGDVVGVKGRIQSNENGIEVIAEKVTFLSSSRKED